LHYYSGDEIKPNVELVTLTCVFLYLAINVKYITECYTHFKLNSGLAFSYRI